MKRRQFLTSLTAIPLLARGEGDLAPLRWRWPCMGSLFRCFLSKPPPADLEGQVRKLLQDLELTFSVHRPDSQAIALCRAANAAPGTPVKVSKDLFRLTREAVEFSKKTLGYFDLTFGSLTSYWRSCAALNQMPDPKHVALLKKRVDYTQLSFHEQAIAFQPLEKSVLLDYGGIAKGYAADRVGELLKSAGIEEAVIDLGGEILVLGKSPHPIVLLDHKGQAHGQVIQLSESALSTSGDLYQAIKNQDEHRSHVLSKSQPDGVQDNVTITVRSKTATAADCLSTAAHAAHGTPAFEKISRLCDEVWVFGKGKKEESSSSHSQQSSPSQ